MSITEHSLASLIASAPDLGDLTGLTERIMAEAMEKEEPKRPLPGTLKLIQRPKYLDWRWQCLACDQHGPWEHFKIHTHEGAHDHRKNCPRSPVID